MIKQEPGDGYLEIINGVKYVRPGGGFEAKGTFFQKINTNGKNEAKIYTYLKVQKIILVYRYMSMLKIRFFVFEFTLSVGDGSYVFLHFISL
ncbi:Epididymal secretory glutathione peroxidase, partial [Armadillidium vulgare]